MTTGTLALVILAGILAQITSVAVPGFIVDSGTMG